MKKNIFIFIFLCSSLLFANMNTIQVKKVDNILSSQQDIKSRLELLKQKESYIQELEKNSNKEISIINLDKKYKNLEKKFLKRDLDNLNNKKEFLEFEKNLYKELFERMENIEKQI